ncbi:MAG: MarR family winged helix-turn-helix transcriptional regulator [Micrococcaceae bacterium]
MLLLEAMKECTAWKLHLLVAKLDKQADFNLKQEFGVSYRRALCLMMINDGDSITQHQLAVELECSDPAISNMLVELKQEKLVITKQDPNHGRRKIVELTTDGKNLADKIELGLVSNFSNLLKVANVEEKDFRKILEILLKML